MRLAQVGVLLLVLSVVLCVLMLCDSERERENCLLVFVVLCVRLGMFVESALLLLFAYSGVRRKLMQF